MGWLVYAADASLVVFNGADLLLQRRMLKMNWPLPELVLSCLAVVAGG
jgi:hypothetical protein